MNTGLKLSELLVTQKGLNRIPQIKSIIESIKEGAYINPILVSETEDGKFRIEDGTHRSVAYLLSGREYLEYGEFEIVPFNKSRVTIGTLVDKMKQMNLSEE